MAIVRQKTTVFNKPVGVVRSNVGAQQIGESISRAASGIQRIAFQEATQVAQKKGADFAKALDSEQKWGPFPDHFRNEIKDLLGIKDPKEDHSGYLDRTYKEAKKEDPT